MNPILTVDLSEGRAEVLDFPQEWAWEYVGGASLAARILYARLVSELDPLGEEAPLLFMTGPLTGTAGPAVGRFVVCGRSPATDLWGESNCGGFWGPALRFAGFDGLLVTGRAPQPVYLWIHESQVEIRPAVSFWGLDTYQTQFTLKEALGRNGVRVACIGRAGEAQIPFALILCDHGRVAGRTGMGAVMGSKNLKAIAVQGDRALDLADPGGFARLRSETNRSLRADPVSRVLHELGSAGAADYMDYLGEMPKRYFQRAWFDGELGVGGAAVKESILVGESTCHACVIACGRVVRLEDQEKRKGPEYETLVGFGPNLWLNDARLATQLGELSDRYGMDSISLSNTIGLAFTLFEKGHLTLEDTGGLALEWGDGRAVEQLVHLTARREGIGAYLAEGSRALARRFGAEGEAVQVNGLEVPYHDPRGASGMALVYATSPRGACHNQSDYFLVDLGQADSNLGMEYYPPRAGVEKAANVARHQDWRTLCNSLVLCYFANVAPESVVELINAACGLQWSLADMLRAGERGWNLKRLINHRLGLKREDEKLPKALLTPFGDGPHDDHRCVPDLEAMLEAYYAARGWERATGLPTREKLVELGLAWIESDS